MTEGAEHVQPGAIEVLKEVGLHLVALCNHPVNWEHRYNVAAGRPCCGCYDARDAFLRWAEANGVEVPL